MKQYTIADIDNFSELTEEQKLKAAKMISEIPTQEGYLTSSAKFFQKNNWVKIENVIDKKLTEFLYEYVKLEAVRLSAIEHKIDRESPDYDKSIYGEFYDTQAPGDFSKYGDLTFDTILAGIASDMKKHTGLNLTPTYSYHRLYTHGTELTRHRDRPSCEVSATMCIGSDTSNLKNTEPSYKWPMFVKNDNEDEIPIELNPGDVIIYRGCEVEHWRLPFKGTNQAQAFFHYNEKDGQYDIKFDCRPALGLPLSYRDEDKLARANEKSGIVEKVIE